MTLFLERKQKDFDEKRCRKIIGEVLPGVNVEINGHTIELLNPVYQEDIIYLIHRLGQPVIARKILYTNQYVGSTLAKQVEGKITC